MFVSSENISIRFISDTRGLLLEFPSCWSSCRHNKGHFLSAAYITVFMYSICGPKFRFLLLKPFPSSSTANLYEWENYESFIKRTDNMFQSSYTSKIWHDMLPSFPYHEPIPPVIELTCFCTLYGCNMFSMKLHPMFTPCLHPPHWSRLTALRADKTSQPWHWPLTFFMSGQAAHSAPSGRWRRAVTT